MYATYDGLDVKSTDNLDRERIIPSTLTGSINEAYFNGLNDVSDST